MQIGVCSWSLQVQSVAELGRILDRLGISVVHIACGDPHHASWEEGDRLPDAARAARFQMTAAMIGFPGEDYTTPQTIQATGGFGPSELRAERLDRLRWALERTRQLGLTVLTGHAGYIPDPRSPERRGFLDTLARAGDLASQAGVTFALETGQEAATLLKLTLDELACPHLGVNFDPANMLLYDMGDPVAAVELLAPYIRAPTDEARRLGRGGAARSGAGRSAGVRAGAGNDRLRRPAVHRARSRRSGAAHRRRRSRRRRVARLSRAA